MLGDCWEEENICGGAGFDTSLFRGLVSSNSQPLLFVFDESPYDIATLTNLIRRAFQIMQTNGVPFEEGYTLACAVIKNCGLYSTLEMKKEQYGILLTGIFGQWSVLEHSYPELEGLTLFSCEDGSVMNLILEKKSIIKKWIKAGSLLPHLIPVSNIPVRLHSIVEETLPEHFPELWDYWMAD